MLNSVHYNRTITCIDLIYRLESINFQLIAMTLSNVSVDAIASGIPSACTVSNHNKSGDES